MPKGYVVAHMSKVIRRLSRLVGSTEMKIYRLDYVPRPNQLHTL